MSKKFPFLWQNKKLSSDAGLTFNNKVLAPQQSSGRTNSLISNASTGSINEPDSDDDYDDDEDDDDDGEKIGEERGT